MGRRGLRSNADPTGKPTEEASGRRKSSERKLGNWEAERSPETGGLGPSPWERPLLW